MNQPYAIPHTYNTCRCRRVPGAMPPFNYTRHLHFHKLFELGPRGGVAITIELEPAAINQRGKKLPVQFAELNGSSFCNLLDLIWPQPMRLELSGKLNYAAAKSTVRYTGHFLINCLSGGDLTGPLSVAKLDTWHGETSHCCAAIAHHLCKQTSFFFFPVSH